MSTTTSRDFGAHDQLPKVRKLRHVRKVLLSRKIVLVGAVMILLTTIAAIFAPWIAPYDPYQINAKEALLQPSGDHLLGTDSLGRDTFSRVIYGARISMAVALVAVGISVVFGTALGLIAGYFGGLANTLIMRLVDTLMAIPGVILALTIATLLGGGFKAVVIAVGVSLMSLYARLVCGQAMTLKQNDYVMAERAQGATNLRIMLRHILPNCLPVLIVTVTIQLGAAILMEAGLSFLGVGIRTPTAAWGSMVNEGYKFLSTDPILSIGPGVAIMLLVFGFNMVGDGLRDALDPRLRGTL